MQIDFTKFKQGTSILIQVNPRSSMRGLYAGKVVGTMNTRRSLIDRWVVQLDIFDLATGETKEGYLVSEFGRTTFQFEGLRQEVVRIEIA